MSNTTLVIYTPTFCFVSEQVTLHSLVSHDSFDWTCRGNKAALLKNLVVVVLQLIGISEVDSSVSSPLFKAATKIYNLAKKPKNVRQGLECFLKSEATVLKNHLVDIIEVSKSVTKM